MIGASTSNISINTICAILQTQHDSGQFMSAHSVPLTAMNQTNLHSLILSNSNQANLHESYSHSSETGHYGKRSASTIIYSHFGIQLAVLQCSFIHTDRQQ